MADLTYSETTPTPSATTVEEESKPQDDRQAVNRWHERISISKKNRDQICEMQGWRRFIDEYKGKFQLSLQGLKGTIPVPPVNDIYSFVQADIAVTSFRDPYITVIPRRGADKNPGSLKGAALREAWVNYKWRILKTKSELELEIIDKDLVGHAWHKVGMTFQSEGSGDELKILNEGMYSMRLSWQDVFFNINSRRPPEDCQWMAQRIVRTLDDMKREFPQVASKLQGTKNPYITKDDYERATFKDDIEIGIMYEIWDARDRMIYLVAEGLSDEWLAQPKPWPDYQKEFPFLMYWDISVPDEPYPLSAIAPWEAQVLEKMVVLAQATNHVKRWNRQLLVNQGAIDTASLDKFERGDDGAVIEVTGQGNLNEKARFMDFGQLPTDFYAMLDRYDQIARTTNGQPEIDRGGVTKTQTRTVGELQLIKAGAKSRTDRKVDRFETHCENIARHMMMHFEGNFDSQIEEVVKVTGEPPEEIMAAFQDHFDPVTGTVTFTPQDIEGEYDVEVRAGSTLPPDKESRMHVLETVMTEVLPVISQAGINPLTEELMREFLSDYDMPGLEQAFDRLLQQQAENAAQEQQDQDMQKAKTASEAEKRVAQANQIDVETAITEQALKNPVQVHQDIQPKEEDPTKKGGGQPGAM